VVSLRGQQRRSDGGRPGRPQALASVLRERPDRRLWLSGLSVNGARWMDLILLGWLAFQLTDSPFMVGLAAFARSAPLRVLGPFTGLVADRMHRGRVPLSH
jgi:Transmembrane secretion effector